MNADLNGIPPAGQTESNVKSVAFSLDGFLTYSSVEAVETSLKSGRLFEGIVLAVSHYQVLAVEVIKQYLKTKKKDHEKILERLGDISVANLLLLLYTYDIIDELDYLNMRDLNKYRNKVVHRLIDKINPAIAEKHIKNGIDCLIHLEVKNRQQ